MAKTKEGDQHMKVLIADDEPLSREMLEESLRRWGYNVVVARDGNEARDVLESLTPQDWSSSIG